MVLPVRNKKIREEEPKESVYEADAEKERQKKGTFRGDQGTRDHEDKNVWGILRVSIVYC